jgi:hypothetical protein
LYNLYRGNADFIAEWGRGEKAMRNVAVLEESQEASTCDPLSNIQGNAWSKLRGQHDPKHFLINGSCRINNFRTIVALS